MLWIHDTTLRQPLSVWNNNLKPRHFLNPPTCSSHWRIYTAISEILSSEKIRKKKKNTKQIKQLSNQKWVGTGSKSLCTDSFTPTCLVNVCIFHIHASSLQYRLSAKKPEPWWVNWLLCVKPLSSLLQSFSCSLILFQLHKIVEASAFQLGLQFLLPNMHISLPPDHVIHMTVTGQPLVFSQSAK